ncbi:MAG: hypothetical protein ABI488_17240 [Polyangiaceae bacterium]
MYRSLVCVAFFGVPMLGCSSSGSTAAPQGSATAGSSAQAGSGTAGAGGTVSSGGSGVAGGSVATGGSATAGSASGGGSGSLGGAGGSATSGGATSGGATSGGATSGGATSGAAGAPGGVIVVSDNFDTTPANGPPDPLKWLPPPTGSMNGPTIVSAKFHSAPNSASSTGTSSGQGAALIPVSGLPTADNHFYVRIWVNFAKATNTVAGHAAFLVAGSTLDQSGTELRLGVSIPPGFATAMVDLNLQNPTDGAGGEVTRFSNGFTTGADPLNMSGTTFAADTWTCVEALFDGGHNEFRLWIDGSEVSNMHVTNFAARPTDTARAAWAPSFKFLKIGAQNYSGDIGQVWYDDIVVGSEPIGCK